MVSGPEDSLRYGARVTEAGADDARVPRRRVHVAGARRVPVREAPRATARGTPPTSARSDPPPAARRGPASGPASTPVPDPTSTPRPVPAPTTPDPAEAVPPAGAPPTDPRFGIDELAARSGMSPRNIRAHQSRRLLHPPRRVGRRSVYDPSHVVRLTLIRRLQTAGFSLAAIRALVRAGNEAGELALAWRAEAVAMRFLPGDGFDDGKLAIEPDGMARLLAQPGALQALQGYGLVRRTPAGAWQGTHPVLVEAGRRARELGLPSEEIVRVQLGIAAAAESTARDIVASFRSYFGTERGRSRVLEDYAVLSPVATAIVTATFEVQMARIVREVFALTPDELP